MEEAPVTAATGALGPVVAKLSTFLRRQGEYKLRRGTRKDIKLISSKLKFIHSILWVIWEREDLDAAGKKLRLEAWRLADNMNDAIDDFILSMKHSNDGRRYMQEKIQPSPFQDLKRMVVDVSERCRNRWKMKTSSHTTFSSLFSRTKSTVDTGPGKQRTRIVDPYVHKDISELVGMEAPRDQLIDHLVGEEESSPQLKMASILGAAGMGKTTLARLVYEEIEDKFQARAFVSTTSSHNTTAEVQASILRQLAANSTDVLLDGTKAATKNKHPIDIISTFLMDKRYLIIIDDIWHYREWETIKKSLPDNNLGSRIVTTSRVNAITDKWRDDFNALVYKIDYLVEYEVEKMIAMKPDLVGEGFDHGHGIVGMCRGMPLAVACMISALAKERESQELQGQCVETREVQDRIEEQVKKNGIQNTPGFEPLVESLHLLVSGGLRGDENELLLIGYPIDTMRLTEIPTEIARLQYLETLEVIGTTITRLPAEIGDLKQLKTLDLSWNRWLTKLPRETGNLQHLETLRFSRANITEQPWEIIGTLKKLKTLDMSRNEFAGLPRDIGELQHLKDLDVSWNEGITELPKEIGKLQHLENLNLSETGITKLPREIGNLQQLENLYLTRTGITEVPREIGKLQHLERLDLSDTKVRKIPREIGALKELQDLTAEFGTLPFEAGQLPKLVGLPKCVRQAWKNSHLVSSLAGEILSFSLEDDLEALINHTKHMHVPPWIKEHFNHIHLLDIRICKLEEQDLQFLREMPNLQELCLRFEVVPRKPIVISSGGFAKLYCLIVDSRVPRVTFQEGAMPKLTQLVFQFRFYGGPPNTDHPMGIKHLVYLQQVSFQCTKWYRGEIPCINATIDVMRKEATEHPNEITLKVSGEDDEIFPGNIIIITPTPSSEDRNEACSSSGAAQEIKEIQA